MYGYVDRPVAQLDPTSQLLMWATRSWVELGGRRQCPGHAIGAAFARRNMMAGLQPFLRLIATDNRAGLENFMSSRLACCHVSEHETILLQVVDEASASLGARIAAIALIFLAQSMEGSCRSHTGPALGCTHLTADRRVPHDSLRS